MGQSLLRLMDTVVQFILPDLDSIQVRLRGATASLEWSREGVFDNEVGHLFLATVREEKTARVESVSEKHRSKAPPAALHTVEMLRSASSRLHIGPKQTMDIAERLYTEVSKLGREGGGAWVGRIGA